MQSNEQTTVTEVKATKTQDAIKDTGRVHIGGGAIYYSDVTPSRDATKDAGRVHIGGGAICF